MAFKFITAEEAAEFIHHNDNVGFSGFTAAGTPKVVSVALAKKAEAEHAAGRPFQIGVYTGASTSDYIDGALSRAKAIKSRTPYQSHKDSREAINNNEIAYFDLHLSHLAQTLRYGFLGKVDVAVIEATDVTPDGEILLGPGVGATPTFCSLAEKIIIELNHHDPKELRGMHDIYQPLDPPYRREIPIYKPSDRIGVPVVKVDPKKIIGIVESDKRDGVKPFAPVDEVTMKQCLQLPRTTIKIGLDSSPVPAFAVGCRKHRQRCFGLLRFESRHSSLRNVHRSRTRCRYRFDERRKM